MRDNTDSSESAVYTPGSHEFKPGDVVQYIGKHNICDEWRIGWVGVVSKGVPGNTPGPTNVPVIWFLNDGRTGGHFPENLEKLDDT